MSEGQRIGFEVQSSNQEEVRIGQSVETILAEEDHTSADSEKIDWDELIEEIPEIQKKGEREIEAYTFKIPTIALARIYIGVASDIYPRNIKPRDPDALVCDFGLIEVKKNEYKKGLGIGRSLVRRIISKAKERGCVEIIGNATYLDNHKYESQNDHPYYFYKRLGFSPNFAYPVEDIDAEVQKQIDTKHGEVPMVMHLNKK